MSSQLPDFERAEYVGQANAPVLSQPPAFSQPMVSGDVDARGWEDRQSDRARFVRAITYGVGAAILGSINHRPETETDTIE